jgi:hypothetical protein
MKLLYKAVVIAVVSLGVGVAIFLAALQIHPPSNVPQTKNIPPEADVPVKKIQTSKGLMFVVPVPGNYLTVGYDAIHKIPFSTYIRFNLSSVPKSDYTNTVTYSAVLKLLASSTIPQNASYNTVYIITAAQQECKNPRWKESQWNCTSNDIIASTEDERLIRVSSLPSFYEWTVTSALEKALNKDSNGEVTFKIAGYPLNVKNFNGEIQFWSKRAAAYVGNLSGPTDTLVVTTTTAPSNLIVVATALGTIAGVIVAVAATIVTVLAKGQNKEIRK